MKWRQLVWLCPRIAPVSRARQLIAGGVWPVCVSVVGAGVEVLPANPWIWRPRWPQGCRRSLAVLVNLDSTVNCPQVG